MLPSHGFAANREDLLGSAGCQPATSGSLPDGTLGCPLDVIFETCLRQAAANYRLAAGRVRPIRRGTDSSNWRTGGLAAWAPQPRRSAISEPIQLRDYYSSPL